MQMSLCMNILSRRSHQRHALFSSKGRDKMAALYYSTFIPALFARNLFSSFLYNTTLHAASCCLVMFDPFVIDGIHGTGV